MRFKRRTPKRKEPFFTSEMYGFKLYWMWRRPFIRIVKFSMWGHYGPGGCSIRTR